jgi:hypothetical protein
VRAADEEGGEIVRRSEKSKDSGDEILIESVTESVPANAEGSTLRQRRGRL